ncbi:hypothetical protein PF003_g39750 [Phytophthora fragariae]|nr:hypothetical protein PF003_g39750 [Phytophthora fragariae]
MAPSVRKHERRQQHENRNNSGFDSDELGFGDDKPMLMKLLRELEDRRQRRAEPEAWTNLCNH